MGTLVVFSADTRIRRRLGGKASSRPGTHLATRGLETGGHGNSANWLHFLPRTGTRACVPPGGRSYARPHWRSLAFGPCRSARASAGRGGV